MLSDEYIKELLKQNLEVSQESLRILKKINRARLIGNIYGFIKWLIIIAIAFGAYYYLQPYLDQMISYLKDFPTLMQKIQDLQKSIPTLPR